MIKEYDVPLTKLSSFKLLGSIRERIIFESEEDIHHFFRDNKDKKDWYILGKGSNTIINPAGMVQRILQLSPSISEPQVNGSLLRVNGAFSVARLLQTAQKAGLSGPEFSAGVPASVGGMVYMNFGCWGYQMADIVKEVRVVTPEGEALWLKGDELKYGYRSSVFQNHQWMITEAVLQCVPDDPAAIQQRIKENVARRLAKQPLNANTFGSVFKNPDGDSSGRIIESLGLKGKTIDHVTISEQHGNFFVNEGNATFNDTIHAMTVINEAVYRQYRFRLEPEVRVVT